MKIVTQLIYCYRSCRKGLKVLLSFISGSHQPLNLLVTWYLSITWPVNLFELSTVTQLWLVAVPFSSLVSHLTYDLHGLAFRFCWRARIVKEFTYPIGVLKCLISKELLSYMYLQLDRPGERSYSLQKSANINAVWATLIIEECCRLGLTVSFMYWQPTYIPAILSPFTCLHLVHLNHSKWNKYSML